MGQPNHFVTTAKNYVKTVAREVRDIPTAAGTLVRAAGKIQAQEHTLTPTEQSQQNVKTAAGNFVKQIKEAVSAATDNKPGTSSDTIKTYYHSGEKRK